MSDQEALDAAPATGQAEDVPAAIEANAEETATAEDQQDPQEQQPDQEVELPVEEKEVEQDNQEAEVEDQLLTEAEDVPEKQSEVPETEADQDSDKKSDTEADEHEEAEAEVTPEADAEETLDADDTSEEARKLVSVEPSDIDEDHKTEAGTDVELSVTVSVAQTENVQEDAPVEDGSPQRRSETPVSPNGQSGFYLNVRIDDEQGDANLQNGPPKVVQVEVMSCPVKKPFLGGFRHRVSGIEFHNASSQTYAKKIIPAGIEKSERDTQTVITRNQLAQTANATNTQMTKVGCYVSNVPDRVVIPGKYFTAAEKDALILEKVIILQSYWRRWLSTQYVNRLRRDRDLRMEWERVQTEQKEVERAARVRKEFERRMKPKTKEDFDLLYAALEKWRREEMERIDEHKSGPEKKAALISLLQQEEYLIQSIERHRINANTVNEKEHNRDFLDKAAASKKWRAYDGKMTEMDTPHSLRAQQLRDLYNSLEMSYLSRDERLDVLLTLKYTIKEHECKLTQELMELIDREADLLTRGIKATNLEGLRQRILTIFLQYCKTPLFNPEVARLLKVPADPSTLRKDIYFCPSCNAYLPSSAFPIASNSRIVGRCTKCSKIDNDARLRNDFTKIRAMMTNLRRTEEGYSDGSRVAFTIQLADLQYLVENIWNCQSALSGEMDISELALVRWNRFEHWSPWNCVLFTKEEADAHMRLENFAEAYGRIFIGKVHHRHVLAKNHFKRLIKLSDSMAEEKVGKPKVRNNPSET